ncbi:hypothetical protein HYH03_015684 [Edaphochlamys debaryana]|uniref:Uncharacterized protein n=1 Tax=Edaphochlamys debaryana TaxID=47281 RepID=A0A836BQP1_9CHLO|nr:hypothetical protein HYH03_015684 [Edaphochlamys debaryana]|eukprot:KAG2485621.1 hypothetical protein HYH03_015684 [Edaphochlamys debaryana]
MARGKYQEGEKEEGFDEFGEGSDRATEGKWRPPYGLIAVLCAIFLVVGFGAGFGAGWGAHPDTETVAAAPAPYVQPDTSSAPNDEIIRLFMPVNIMGNATNDAVQTSYDQTAIMNTGFHAMSVVISILGGTNKTFDPNVLRIHVLTKYNGQQDVLAKIFNVAQRLQVSPDFMDQLYELTSSLVDVFKYVQDNQDKIGSTSGAGRRLLAANSAEPLAVQLLKAFVKQGLTSPALAGALGDLTPIFKSVDTIVDLVVDLYEALRGVAADTDQMSNRMVSYHPTVTPPAPPEPTVIEGFANTSVKVTVNPYMPLIVGEADDPLVADVTVDVQPGGRRRLQQQITIPLPAGFTPQPPSALPAVAIPVVWHVLRYRNADGSYGPPGVNDACAMIQRMMQIANYRLTPSKLQLWLKECRNDPNNPGYQYLTLPSREAYLNCAAGDYFYNKCGDMIRPSCGSADYPRAINLYVAGEQPPTDYVGYAFVPGATDDCFYGHVMLTWTTVSTSGVNNRANFESGVSGLVHEVMHHLGMDHTFSDGACSDADAASGVMDTPPTNNPVWSQGWAQKAYLSCLNSWNKILVSDWDGANREASRRVGIPITDQNTQFDSCPGLSGPDEIANYITYTYDICLLAMGHLTSGQIQAMHQITANTNPTLYAWGQYYATPAGLPPGVVLFPQAPAAVAASPPPPPRSPPPSPPPPPPPSQTPVPTPTPSGNSCPAAKTDRGCTCSTKWNFLGKDYFGCQTVPGNGNGGPWCQVDKAAGDCVRARNGWWDYCTPVSCPGGPSPAPSPSPSPKPAPTPSPSNAPASCGAGAVTKNGLTCTAADWKLKSSPTTYKGCANPNNDPKGTWCVLAKGQLSPAGAAWDYCQDGCNTAAPPSTCDTVKGPFPCKQECQRGISISGQPAGCVCADLYSISFDGYGTSYSNQRGCTIFSETGSGMCVVQCTNNKKANGKAYACSCA